MSEFSESLHVRSSSRQDAVSLLERADGRGIVYAPAGGWVSFVCGALPADVADVVAARPDVPPMVAEWMALQEARKAMVRRMVALEAPPLLHYAYAADHECLVVLYVSGRAVGKLEVSFEEPRVQFDPAPFVKHGILSEAASAELAAWCASPSSVEEPHIAARCFGLTNFAWLSFDYAVESERPPDSLAVRMSDETSKVPLR